MNVQWGADDDGQRTDMPYLIKSGQVRTTQEKALAPLASAPAATIF